MINRDMVTWLKLDENHCEKLSTYVHCKCFTVISMALGLMSDAECIKVPKVLSAIKSKFESKKRV